MAEEQRRLVVLEMGELQRCIRDALRDVLAEQRDEATREQYITPRQLAQRINVHEKHAPRLCRTVPELRAVKVGGRWRIPRQALDEWLKRGEGANGQR